MKTNIDTFIKQQVSELDGIPTGVERKSRITWDRIEAELDKEPRRRPLWGWVAAASMGLMATLSFLLMQQNESHGYLAQENPSDSSSIAHIASEKPQSSLPETLLTSPAGKTNSSLTDNGNLAMGQSQKVVRGGDWRDVGYFLSPGNSTYSYDVGPKNQIRSNVVGKLGEKIAVNPNWDKNAPFDFENQFKISESLEEKNNATLNLNEQPLTQKINIGDQPISNIAFGSEINTSSTVVFNGFTSNDLSLAGGYATTNLFSPTAPAMTFATPPQNLAQWTEGTTNLTVVTGGTPASYADVNGGLISMNGQNAGTYQVATKNLETLDKIEVGNVSPRLNGKKGEKDGKVDGFFQDRSTKSVEKLERGRKGWEDPNSVEEYKPVHENAFRAVQQEPLSTFSIDVDRASYSNMRRFINSNQLPHPDAVRIEEMVNYFHYDYKEPKDQHPFNVITEVSDCPWKPEHRLVHIGLQGKKIKTENIPASNLVFLLDVSGSMDSPDKLGLLKQSFGLLTEQLRSEDRVAIVVYAGAAGVVLNSTPGDQKQTILTALNNLNAGGSTAGGAGINLAYKIAKDNFITGGNNRIVLATDGDFNVGINSESGLEELIVEKRKDGIFLSVLGFGMGNYKDSKMEVLADKGNGNYGYIDGLMEAKKTLVNEFGGTMFAIAKDVKLQIEFNPAKVKGYRLVGYENRVLRNEDFANDKIDAGELGAGHTVTALYEIIPAGSKEDIPGFEPLKYQSQQNWGNASDEMLTVKLRYKKPDGEKSILLSHSMPDNGGSILTSSHNFRWSAAVASFGMVLRNSEHQGSSNCDLVLKLARSAQGKDAEGYRAEFITLVQKAKLLKELKNVEVKGE